MNHTVMQEKQKQIQHFLENYQGNVEAPVSLETRNLLKKAVIATTEEEFRGAIHGILPNQLGILAVNYGVELWEEA